MMKEIRKKIISNIDVRTSFFSFIVTISTFECVSLFKQFRELLYFQNKDNLGSWYNYSMSIQNSLE